MGALVATGAFADLSFGISGVQYFDDDSTTVQEAFKNLQDGVGVFYGGFVEITGKHMGLGASFNFNMDDSYGVTAMDTMQYDFNLYMSYHLFGNHFFIDPFVNFGIGMNAYAYQDAAAAKQYMKDYYDYMYIYPYPEDAYIDEDDPLYASLYCDFSAGLGINLGGIGIFVKGSYVMPLDGVVKGTYDDDIYDYDQYWLYYISPGDEYDIPAWFTSNFKWTFGARINLY